MLRPYNFERIALKALVENARPAAGYHTLSNPKGKVA